jgi:hypothetical protein
MIGKCPNCGIQLSIPPFEGRQRNEVLLTLEYRKMIESNAKFKPVEEIGHCELCNAKVKDIENQVKVQK